MVILSMIYIGSANYLLLTCKRDFQITVVTCLGKIDIKTESLIYPLCQYGNEVKDMSNIEKEAKVIRGIEAIISNRHIVTRIPYLRYLKEQKEIKRAKAEARMKDAELEIRAIEKMINREEAKGLEEEEVKDDTTKI